jgi:ribosomal protein L40E
MEWRCEWCGKPHEENDPPCDNCGHGSFEKAVVRRTDLSEGSDEASTVVWVCTECGREHTKHSPPCSRCNNATLERQEKTLSDEELTAGPNSAQRATHSADTTRVWVCTECGREHPRHSPPCSRCGSPDLEEQTKEVGADELDSPSYVDLLTPRYALALVGVLALATVFVLGATGVINVPLLFPGESLPDVENVPGNEYETASGVSLAEVEDAYVEAINEQRTANGLAELERDDRLDEIMTVYNQQRVKIEFTGTTEDIEQTQEQIREECPDGGYESRLVEPENSGESAAEIGQRFAATSPASTAATEVDGQIQQIGLDVHAVDGRLYLQQLLCV